MRIADALAVVGAVVAVTSLLWTLTRPAAARVQKVESAVQLVDEKYAREVASVHARISEFARQTEARGVALETKIEVFWRTVAIPAAGVLHSPHPQHARRDQLLEHLMAGVLTAEEAVELARLVGPVREDPAASQAEQLAAGQILAYLIVRFDAQ